jgi:DNA-binding IclR family transcriptional regulator
MSGLDRFVAVLSLYSETADVWSVQEMANALDMPASTVYRIVRDLVKASFLEPATGARYRLGSAGRYR